MKSSHIMVIATVAILLAALPLLTGCGSTDRPEPIIVTKEVSVPVGQFIQPPSILWRTPVDSSELPQWLAPGDPRATSCVAPDGEAKIRTLGNDREGRLDGWEQWLISR